MNIALLTNTVVGGGDAAASSASGGGLMSNPVLLIIVYVVVIFGAMYFFSIKPQKKKKAELENMRNNIAPGDSVLLDTGFFGKVVDVTAECYIVEFGTNKSIRIPVLKQAVYAKKEPNLTNKVEEEPEPEKKSLFGKKKEAVEDKKVEETKTEETKAEE